MSTTWTDAIVLRAIDYGESDRIFGLLTREFGKVSVFARGARKSKRRYPGVDLFATFRAGLNAIKLKNNSFAQMDAVEGLRQNLELRADLFALCQASYLAECTWTFTGERDAQPGFFDWWVGALERLRGKCGSVDQVRLDLEMLRWFGYLPSLGDCIECARPIGDENVFFAFDRGGVVCKGCHRPSSGRWMHARDLEEGRAPFLRSTLDAFVRHTLGKEPKSQRIREELCYGTATRI